jgi:hypothetical protein
MGALKGILESCGNNRASLKAVHNTTKACKDESISPQTGRAVQNLGRLCPCTQTNCLSYGLSSAPSVAATPAKSPVHKVQLKHGEVYLYQSSKSETAGQVSLSFLKTPPGIIENTYQRLPLRNQIPQLCVKFQTYTRMDGVFGSSPASAQSESGQSQLAGITSL